MNMKQIFAIIMVFIVLMMMATLPLWWDSKIPLIFGFPAYLMAEIDAYINAIKWLIDLIFG